MDDSPMRIRDIIKRDLDIKIEEVIKVDQSDDETVYSEITEYVATDNLKSHYQNLLQAIVDGRNGQDEKIAIWISGFFGSGKSSFAKNLGYAITNKNVKGSSAADLLLDQLDDKKCRDLLRYIHLEIPMDAVMLDVSTGTDIVRADEKIAAIMYRALLKKLNYSIKFEVADLEIALEREGNLNRFIELFDKKYAPNGERTQWRQQGRSSATWLNRASSVLHQLDPNTYPVEDSYAKSSKNSRETITVDEIVNRTFELMERRLAGQSLIFILDEVGQYVSRSSSKIEDLRAVVEQFGKESKNRIKRKEIKAPIWIVVTSQEKLNEVVTELDSRTIEIAKLQDRFRPIDLIPSDISEVTTKRVLTKNVKGEKILGEMFDKDGARLNTYTRLEGSYRFKEITKGKFVEFYPYLPHHIDLNIDIVSGLRLQSGAPRHIGAGARTIIKQAYEMLVSDKTKLAEAPVGQLVTIDRTYDLVDSYLASEKQKDILDIEERFCDEPRERREWAIKVAKALALLEFVKDLKRTENNIAALLVDRIGDAAPVENVKNAIQLLDKAQFVKNTEDGYKLLTVQEKTWENEKSSIGKPRPKDANEILAETIKYIFEEPALRKPSYKGYKNFGIALKLDGKTIFDEGEITLNLRSVYPPSAFKDETEKIVDESRQKDNTNSLFIAYGLTQEIEERIHRVYASTEMIRRHQPDILRLTQDEARSVSNEDSICQGVKAELRDMLKDTIASGVYVFRGLKRDMASQGNDLPQIVKAMFDHAIPILYNNLEMGAIELSNSDAEELVKAADLSGVGAIFHRAVNEGGLGLIVKREGRYVLTTESPVTQEILSFIRARSDYGEPLSGKVLDDHFTSIPYGWTSDLIRVEVAALLKANHVVMTLRGNRYSGTSDVRARKPFDAKGGIKEFKAAEFSIATTVSTASMTRAAEALEGIIGREVYVSLESIKSVVNEWVRTDLVWLGSTKASVEALELPSRDLVEDYMDALIGLRECTEQDCVMTLAESGSAIKEKQKYCMKLRDTLDQEGRSALNDGRVAAKEMMEQLGFLQDLRQVHKDLQDALESEKFFEKMGIIRKNTKIIQKRFQERYSHVHNESTQKYSAEVESINGHPDALKLDRKALDLILQPLSRKICSQLSIADNQTTCTNCHATIKEMEADILAVDSIAKRIIDDMTASNQQPIDDGIPQPSKIRLVDYLPQRIRSLDEAETAIARLKEAITRLLEEGSTVELE